MNLFALNGGLLNGTRLITVAAAATIACSAAVSASASFIQNALSPVSSGAQITASATTTRSASCNVSCSASIAALQTHTQVAAASAQASASIQAFVLREQVGSALFFGAANIVAIPASVLGNASVSAGATLIANATKIQPGYANAPNTAAVTISVAPLVTRYVLASMPCGASIRVEPAYKPSGGSNFILESYAQPMGLGNVSVTAGGTLVKVGVASISSAVSFAGVGTHIKPGSAVAAGVASAMNADLNFQIGGLGNMTCSAAISADAQHWHGGASSPAGTSVVAAAAVQTHGSASAVMDGEAEIYNDSSTRRFGFAALDVGAGVQVGGTRVLKPEVVFDSASEIDATASMTRLVVSSPSPSTADVSATPNLIFFSDADLGASGADVYASAFITKMPTASIPASAEVVADGERWIVVQSMIDAGSSVVADATRRLDGSASMSGFAEIDADTIANPDSIDPDERTFVRPALLSDFVRPAYTSEFRRAA